MDKKRESYYRKVFLIAAIYDIILGIIFTFFYKFAYSLLNIPLPENTGYIVLIGAFLFVIGIAYYLIYRGDLRKNINLIKIGALYKFAYAAVVFYYWIFGTIPHISFVLIFGVADIIFLVLFVECLNYLKR